MNIIDQFLNVHRQAEDVFARLESLQEAVAQRPLLEQLCQDLTAHEGVEETLFYPVIMKLQQDRKLAQEGLDQQQELRDFIKSEVMPQLQGDQLKPVIQRLKNLVIQHVKTEEGQIFPSAREHIDDSELNRLGDRYDEVQAQQKEQAIKLTVTMLPETKVQAPRT